MNQVVHAWQEWAVALVLLCCAFWVGRYLRSFFLSDKKKSSPCDSCVTGCDIKRLYDQKQKDCVAGKQKEKKSCCK